MKLQKIRNGIQFGGGCERAGMVGCEGIVVGILGRVLVGSGCKVTLGKVGNGVYGKDGNGKDVGNCGSGILGNVDAAGKLGIFGGGNDGTAGICSN